MITLCKNCSTKEKPIKTRQIDASVYAGDYHSPPKREDYAFGRQCTECGAVYAIGRTGQTKRPVLVRFANLPPRKNWQEPLDSQEAAQADE